MNYFSEPIKPDTGIQQSKKLRTWPEDSWLTPYLDFARKYSEASDEALVGCILPVVGAILARRIWVDFAGNKYPNLYTMIAARPGFRKSTTIDLAEKIAWRTLKTNQFTSSIASEEALFSEYDEEADGSPDKLLIVDEGNQILSNWANTSYGKIVAKRYLSLYDCKPFQVSFQKNLKSGGSVVKRIDETSTSFLLGATLNVANFQGLESADGMRRRFITYLVTDLARVIHFPQSMETPEFESLWRPLSDIPRTIAGEVEFTDDGRERFIEIQNRNRRDLMSLSDNADPTEAGLLAEQVSIVLKLGMIFQSLRAISPNSPISPSRGARISLDDEVLKWAYMHARDRSRDAIALNRIGNKQQTLAQADKVYSIIIQEMRNGNIDGDSVVLTRTQLTSKFAKHPDRKSDLSSRLYSEIIPTLIEQELCYEIPSPGKLKQYAFRIQE